MSNDRKDRSPFVEHVREHTQRYLAELSKGNEVLRLRIESLECEKSTLESRLTANQTDLEHQKSQFEELSQRLNEAEKDYRDYTAEHATIEQENNALASLYVATYSLHGTLDQEELLRAIQEIIANLVGSEEIAIFELSEDGSELLLLASMGIDAGRYQRISVGSGLIGQSVQSEELYSTPDSECGPSGLEIDENLTVSVPLRIDGEPIGAIAIFRLLTQKSGLEPVDFELFDLLATQAAMALHLTKLHSRFRVASAALGE
jgi:hypothetical protein